ncbi:unnamed protein product, partial [Amoebophrya sp. A25]
VYYYSASSQGWIPAVVERTDGVGLYFVDVKPDWGLHGWRLRPRGKAQQEIEQGMKDVQVVKEDSFTKVTGPAILGTDATIFDSSDGEWWGTSQSLAEVEKRDQERKQLHDPVSAKTGTTTRSSAGATSSSNSRTQNHPKKDKVDHEDYFYHTAGPTSAGVQETQQKQQKLLVENTRPRSNSPTASTPTVNAYTSVLPPAGKEVPGVVYGEHSDATLP